MAALTKIEENEGKAWTRTVQKKMCVRRPHLHSRCFDKTNSFFLFFFTIVYQSINLFFSVPLHLSVFALFYPSRPICRQRKVISHWSILSLIDVFVLFHTTCALFDYPFATLSLTNRCLQTNTSHKCCRSLLAIAACIGTVTPTHARCSAHFDSIECCAPAHQYTANSSNADCCAKEKERNRS